METRFNGNVVPFASNATSGERTIFGDWNTESDDINDNLNTDFITGWEAGLEGALNPYPPSQYFNAALYTSSALTAYLYQQGIAEWNIDQKYKINSFAIGSNGDIYRSKTGTDESPNLGNNPIADTINWENKNYDDSHSFLTNGYQKFSNGLIIQWGSAVTTIPSTNTTLPIAFPNQHFITMVSDAGTTTIEALAGIVVSLSQFKARAFSASSGTETTSGFFFFSIGY